MLQNKNTWENSSHQSLLLLFPSVQAGPPNPLLTDRGELLLKFHTTGDGFFCLMGHFGTWTTLWTSQTREGQMASTLHSSHKLKYDGAMDKGLFTQAYHQWLGPEHWLISHTIYPGLPFSSSNPSVKRTTPKSFDIYIVLQSCTRLYSCSILNTFSDSTITKLTQPHKKVSKVKL